MDASASLPALPRHLEPVAELVVVNGRLGGARRALSGPLTLVGQGAGCDLRLLDDGVAQFHCAIVIDAQGPLLRNLGSPSGTRINGKAVETHRLVNGDRIEVGQVQIEVALETPPTAERPSVDVVLIDRDREALRIQAAAVAAQQAAMDEVEAKLDQRQVGLDRQETQLARHLDERGQQLDQADQALEGDRAALASERETMARDKVELAKEKQEIVQQRKRLQELQRRLTLRYEEMGRKRELELQRREAELVAESEKLKRERACVQAFHERINGERELGRQQLRDQRRNLEQDRSALEATLHERAETLQREQAELARQAAEVAGARESLAAERYEWECRHATLNREVEGLEARIRNTRERLDALGHQKTPGSLSSAAGEVIPPAMSPALQPPAMLTLPQDLRDMAGLLSDQRAHLLSQWRQLLDLQQKWQEERRATLAELELAAEELAGREQDLGIRQRQIAQDEAGLVRLREDLAVKRAAMHGWRSRIATDEALSQAQAHARQDDLAGREALLEQRRQQLEVVNQRRNQRRKQEVAELLGLRSRCEDARRQYLERWQEYDRLRAQQDQCQRDLSAHAQAIEQAREELIHASPDSARVAAQIDKLRKRERARLDAAAGELDADRRRFQQDLARGEKDARQANQREDELLARQLDLTRRMDEWEAQHAIAQEEDARRQEEMRRLRARHAIDERQLRQLREELERLASLLIEEGDSGQTRAA